MKQITEKRDLIGKAREEEAKFFYLYSEDRRILQRVELVLASFDCVNSVVF